MNFKCEICEQPKGKRTPDILCKRCRRYFNKLDSSAILLMWLIGPRAFKVLPEVKK